MVEYHEIEVMDELFSIRKLTGFQLLNVTGSNMKMGEVYRDLIFNAVFDPDTNTKRFTESEIEDMDYPFFIALGSAIFEFHQKDIKNYQERKKSKTESKKISSSSSLRSKPEQT